MNEMGVLTGTAFLYMMLAMWAVQPSRGCELVQEPRRLLNPDRQLDREHLARDAERVRGAARRYASRSEPSQSAERAIEHCEALLAQQIADQHAVPRQYMLNAVRGER